MSMLTEICKEIRNFFTDRNGKHFGTFEISGGVIKPLDFVKDGQYFRIVGSSFNDGVYKNPSSASELTDETFIGAVWAMNVPPAFLKLCDQIEEYENSDAAKPSPYNSESFGGYSYSKATESNGATKSWKTEFASKLKKWRKL